MEVLRGICEAMCLAYTEISKPLFFIAQVQVVEVLAAGETENSPT